MIKMKIILFCLPAIIAGVIVGAILISTASDKINERKEYHGFSPILAFLFMIFAAFVGIMVQKLVTGIGVFSLLPITSGVVKMEQLSDQLNQEKNSKNKKESKDPGKVNSKQNIQESQKKTRENQEKKLRKLAVSGEADIFINGEPTSDDFDLDGIRLKNYEIKFKNGKVYLISY